MNVDERVVVADLGLGRFQIDFENEEDIVEVMKKEPFHFDNWMLSIVRWEHVVEDNYLSKVTFWVRVIGVPLHFWAVQTFKSVGEALGEVRGEEDVDLDEGKVRVVLDAFKPLIFSVTVEFHSGEETTIALRYEKLHGFCRICSSLRHDQSKCPTVKNEVDGGNELAQVSHYEQGPSNLSYKGAVESKDKGFGTDGTSRRGPQHAPRSKDYKGKGIAYEGHNREYNYQAGRGRSFNDQGVYFKNLRRGGYGPHPEETKRYAMDTGRIDELRTQDEGVHLTDQQRLMLEAFKSGEKELSTASKTRRALLFDGNSKECGQEEEGNRLGTTMEVLVSKNDGVQVVADGLEEDQEIGLEEMEAFEGDLLEDQKVADQLESMEKNLEMEIEVQGEGLSSNKKEKEGQATKKKNMKMGIGNMGGNCKKRLVQRLISPRKKTTAKQPSKVGERGQIPLKKVTLKDPTEQE